MQSSLISTVVDLTGSFYKKSFAIFSNFYCCRFQCSVVCANVLQVSLISTVVDSSSRLSRAGFAIFSNFYCCRCAVDLEGSGVLQSSLISTVVDCVSPLIEYMVLQSSLISTVVDIRRRSRTGISFAIFSNFYCCRSVILFNDGHVLQSSLISTVVDDLPSVDPVVVLQASLISTVVDRTAEKSCARFCNLL